jgi:hypothetical protein
VALLVSSVTDDAEVIAAALLHDTVEDCGVSFDELARRFGPRVRNLVHELTNVSKPEDGNRAIRKRRDLIHLSLASPDGQTIKLADLISNSESIVAHDPKFAKVYMEEKRDLLAVLQDGHPILRANAARIVSDYFTGAVEPEWEQQTISKQEMAEMGEWFTENLNAAVKDDQLPDFAASRGQNIPPDLRG